MNAHHQGNIIEQALSLTAEELTTRAAALEGHAQLLFSEGLNPNRQGIIISQALNLTAEELTARARALDPLVRICSLAELPAKKRAFIVTISLGRSAEEISASVKALLISQHHFMNQKEPFARYVIIRTIINEGLESSLVQRGLDAALNESLSGNDARLALAFLLRPNSLYDKVKAAYEERIRTGTPEIREFLIDAAILNLGEDHLLVQEFKRISSQVGSLHNTPKGE
jgi:hypothetical protein